MKKTSLFCLLAIIFLISIKHVKADDCTPTISWKADSSYYVGETGKLIATISNKCEGGFSIRTTVGTEKAYGYIKVYLVGSIDEEPTPIKHSETVSNTTAEFLLPADSTKEVVYFVQPDEKALPGSFTLHGSFLVEKKLQEIKEISITVKKPLTIAYKLPSSLKIDTPFTSTITIDNTGSEVLKSINICLFSLDNIVSFSEKCKSWKDLPPNYEDTFTFKVLAKRIKPDTYIEPIKVNVDYTTYTGLTVVDPHTHPSITIAAVREKPPNLSYRLIKGTGNISFYITNEGEGTAYGCNLKLTTPVDCLLNSELITRHVKGLEDNKYEVDCGEEIIQDDFTTTVLTFDSSQITSSCLITGTILFEDTMKKSYQTEVRNFNLLQVTTTTTGIIGGGMERSKLIIFVVLIIIVVIMAAPFIIRIYRKRKAKEWESYQETTTEVSAEKKEEEKTIKEETTEKKEE